jgi:hypothetical protein
MRAFVSILNLHFKKSLAPRNIIIWGLFLVLSFIYTNQGINRINALEEKEKSFTEIQQTKFEKIRSYTYYSIEGIRSLYSESNASIFFKNSIVPIDSTSKVDGRVTVKLSNNLKSKILDPANLLYNMDFSGLVLFIFLIYSVYQGYESVRHRALLKMLKTGKSSITVYVSSVLAGFIIFALYFCLLSFSQVLFIQLSGIEITAADFAGFCTFLSVALVLLFFFYSLGVVSGTIRKKGLAFAFMVAAWFGFIFMIPALVNSALVGKIPDVVSDYKTVIDKYKILNDFEKRTIAKHGKPKNVKREEAKKVMTDFINNEYVKIEALEKKLRSKWRNVITSYSKTAINSPVTFYLLTGNEVSSRGYQNFLEFYNFSIDQKRRFLKFRIDNAYNPEVKKVLNYHETTGQTNVFHAQSRIPDHYGMGILINLGYSVILLVFGCFRFLMAMFRKPEEANSTAGIELDLYKGRVITLNTVEKDFIRQFLNVFLGKADYFKGSLMMDGEDFVSPGDKDLLYLPSPDTLPGDIRGIDLLTTFKRLYNLDKTQFEAMKAAAGDNAGEWFGEMKLVDKMRVMLAVAELKKWEIFIFDKWVNDLPKKYYNEIGGRIRNLIADHTLVIDIVPNYNPWLNYDNQVICIYDEHDNRYHVELR